MPQTNIPALGQEHIAEHPREQEITGVAALSCKFRSVRPLTHYLTGASICHEVMSDLKHAKQDALDRAVQLPEFNPPLTMLTCRPGPGVCSLKIMWLPSEWLHLQRTGTSCGELCSSFPTPISSQWSLVWKARRLKPMTSSKYCVSSGDSWVLPTSARTALGRSAYTTALR